MCRLRPVLQLSLHLFSTDEKTFCEQTGNIFIKTSFRIHDHKLCDEKHGIELMYGRTIDLTAKVHIYSTGRWCLGVGGGRGPPLVITGTEVWSTRPLGVHGPYPWDCLRGTIHLHTRSFNICCIHTNSLWKWTFFNPNLLGPQSKMMICIRKPKQIKGAVSADGTQFGQLFA